MNTNKSYCVYKHTAPNGKVYIGITCQNPLHRWCNGNGYKGNTHFYNAIKKYGWNNFKHEILFEELTANEAAEKEIELIAKYKSNNIQFGYNLTSGGLSYSEKHPHYSEQSKLKIKRNHKGTRGYHFTEQQKRNISISKNATKKSVLCIELNIIFPSLSEAAKYVGGTYANISSCCHGKLETSAGYHWRFVSNGT